MDQATATAGCVINTGGFESPNGGGIPGADTLVTIVDRFRVDVVLVVGHDRLYEQLKAALHKKQHKSVPPPAVSSQSSSSSPPSPSSPSAMFPSAIAAAASGFDGDQNDIAVIKLQRSGGVVNRDLSARRKLQGRRFRDYFYGATISSPLQLPSSSSAGQEDAHLLEGGGATAAAMMPAFKPHLMELPFDKVKLWRHSDDSTSAGAGIDGLMPMTEDDVLQEPGQLELVEPDSSLLHSVAAVYHPSLEPPAAACDLGSSSPLSAIAATAISTNVASAFVVDDNDNNTNSNSAATKGCGNANSALDEFAMEAAEAQALAIVNAAGFVVIQEVNLERRTLTVLAPCAGMLPSLNFVVGRNIKWMES